ncbi:hypothetical protein LX36DRAFT_655163 [Colletotrichum falcatum]|nr:hypothetical protein LX36DRAFT_655163 [Colletotrichum falcatum]
MAAGFGNLRAIPAAWRWAGLDDGRCHDRGCGTTRRRIAYAEALVAAVAIQACTVSGRQERRPRPFRGIRKG